MKTILFALLSCVIIIGLSAQNRSNTDNGQERLLDKENRLDSIWRNTNIWQEGVAKIGGESFKDLSSIKPPRWAKWDYNLGKYYTSEMIYPEHLLKINQAGYSVVTFSIDTLGFPHDINILTSINKEFDNEVIRLTKELPHCLPCRDENDKRMECSYTVYVPFLPQHYREYKEKRTADEQNEHLFIHYEGEPYFPGGGGVWAPKNYITQRLKYDPSLLGDKQQVKGVYDIMIDSYGDVYDAKVIRSCGIADWDNQVLEIIKGMPRWTPADNTYGKGKYTECGWIVPVIFNREKQE